MNTRPMMIGLFALAVLAQLAVPGWILVEHESVFRNGETYRFRCAPVDPADPFRGRYVALRFADMRTERIHTLQPWIDPLYVTFEEDEDGYARPEAVHADPPEDRPYLKIPKRNWRLAGKTDAAFDLPFDRFYMDEQAAPEAEDAMRDRDTEAHLVVRILNGQAVPVELVIE